MTRRELAYICLDQLKVASDDAYMTVDHVLFLASKIRAMILKQRYADIKKEIPESNYQTICLDLQRTTLDEDNPCSPIYVKSVQKIPSTLNIGTTSIHPVDYYQGTIAYVSRERMRYVGHNPWLKNIIYASLGPDQHIYLQSDNPQYQYLKKIQMTGIFEDIDEVSKLECNMEGEDSCDPLDRRFPLEEGLVSTVIELIVKYLSGAVYRPKDEDNNANDQMSDIMTFLRRNMKSNFQKQLDND